MKQLKTLMLVKKAVEEAKLWGIYEMLIDATFATKAFDEYEHYLKERYLDKYLYR